MILDWWLSPELYLRRPPAKYPEYRLDRLLKRRAEAGVKIMIICYKASFFDLSPLRGSNPGSVDQSDVQQVEVQLGSND